MNPAGFSRKIPVTQMDAEGGADQEALMEGLGERGLLPQNKNSGRTDGPRNEIPR
jgi:hypothetical protein